MIENLQIVMDSARFRVPRLLPPTHHKVEATKNPEQGIMLHDVRLQALEQFPSPSYELLSESHELR